jgi:hypothetical protein
MGGVAVGAVFAAAGAARSQSAAVLHERAVATRRPVLAVLERKGYPLVRVDPVTLRRSGRSLSVGTFTDGWAFSPDRSQLALAVETPRLRVRFVDLKEMRSRGDVELAQKGSFSDLAWPTPSRLLAVIQVPEGENAVAAPHLVAVDARAHRIVADTALSGTFLRATHFRNGLVVLLGSPGEIAPVRVAVADAAGAVRVVSLERIPGGLVSPAPDAGSYIGRAEIPALAVDSEAQRAYVVGADQLVAEIDLQTLTVTYHELQERFSAFASRPGSLGPRAAAKWSTGHVRRALWLGNGTFALSGEDTSGTPGVDARGNHIVIDAASAPAGLKLVDTRSFSTRTLDANASDFSFAGGILLATGMLSPPGARATGIGLVGYDLAGRRRFHRFGADFNIFMRTAAHYIYVYRNERGDDHVLVLNLRSGRVVRDLRARMPTPVTAAETRP